MRPGHIVVTPSCLATRTEQRVPDSSQRAAHVLVASTRATSFFFSSSFLLQQACKSLRAGQALSYRRFVIPKPGHGHAMFIRLTERARPSAPARPTWCVDCVWKGAGSVPHCL